jgi:hypothetical protein
MMNFKDSWTCDLELSRYYYFRTPASAIPCNDVTACFDVSFQSMFFSDPSIILIILAINICESKQ